MPITSQRGYTVLVASVVLCGLAGRLAAEEAADAFVHGLRDRGHFEEALAYIEKAKTNPAVSTGFKEVADYEAGATLMAWTGRTEDPAAREALAKLATDSFARFLKDHPDHERANTARMQAANAMVEVARLQVASATQPTLSTEKASRLREQARDKLLEAQKILTALEQHFAEEHKKFPKFIDPTEYSAIERRDEVRKNLVQSRLSLAAVTYEISTTYPPGSAQRKEYLTEAADRYEAFSQKYRAFLAGLYARLCQTRCLKDLGETKRALTMCEELLLQPDSPQAFRDLKAKAVVATMETHLLPEVKGYREALRLGNTWLENASVGDSTSARGLSVDLGGNHKPNETATPDGLAIQYYTGVAAMKLAETLDKNNPQRSKLLTVATKRLGAVSKLPGDHQQAAKEMLRQVP